MKESEVQTENGEVRASAVNAKAEADGDAGEAEVSAEPEGRGVLAAQSAQILPEL